MDFYNFFKSFLGIPNSVPPNDFYNKRFDDDPSNTLPNENSEEGSMGFNVFSNPLEMQRYFEQQMNEVMRSFGIPSEGSFLGEFFGLGDHVPSIESPEKQSPSRSLRDQFLKPGYESASTEKEKLDTDVDGKVDITDLDTVFQPDGGQQIIPIQKPTRYFSGQKMSSKTVVKPDGSIETHRTIQDSEGNVETIVTHRNGDQEYTVTTRTDKHGKQEKEEKLVNIDEKDLDRFLPVPESHMHPNFNHLFEKFFK